MAEGVVLDVPGSSLILECELCVSFTEITEMQGLGWKLRPLKMALPTENCILLHLCWNYSVCCLSHPAYANKKKLGVRIKRSWKM